MPGEMMAKVIGMRPLLAALFNPGNAVGVGSLHLMNMCHCMGCPHIKWLGIDRSFTVVLGRLIIAAFFMTKAQHPEHKISPGMILGPMG